MISTLKAGDTLVRQGEPGSDRYLVLDGVVRVDRDGEQPAEVGPGAVPAERAHLEGGIRTAAGLTGSPVPTTLAADGDVIVL
jgi:CRP-like cAMP-binding protein